MPLKKHPEHSLQVKHLEQAAEPKSEQGITLINGEIIYLFSQPFFLWVKYIYAYITFIFWSTRELCMQLPKTEAIANRQRLPTPAMLSLHDVHYKGLHNTVTRTALYPQETPRAAHDQQPGNAVIPLRMEVLWSLLVTFTQDWASGDGKN